jgi:hypothetical protein
MPDSPSDTARPHPVWPRRASGIIGVAAVLGLGFLALSQSPPPAAPGAEAGSAAPELGPCIMDREGYLSGELFGAIELEFDWAGDELTCEGNARPDGHGLRLFFAGNPQGAAERLIFVLGIEARIDELAGSEHEVNVTLIDESQARFFNGGEGRCWTRVDEVVQYDAGAAYRVDGELYCAGALPSLTDPASVTPGSVVYSGRLNLGDD